MLTTFALLLAAQGGLASEPAPVIQEPAQGWKGTLSGGLTLVSGNNESTTGSFNAAFERTWGAWAVNAYAGYTGVRTEDPATKVASTTARIITFGGGGKRYLDDTNNLYVFVKGGDRRNEPGGLTERVDFGGGVGYRWDLYENAFLGAELGASYVTEELVGVATEEETGAVRLGYSFEAPLSAGPKFYGNGEYLNGGDVESLTSATGLKWAFAEDWDFFTELQLFYDGSPAPGFEDTDTILVIGISTAL